MLRTIRNIFVSALMLAVIFAGAGVAYVMLAGGDDSPEAEDSVLAQNTAPVTELFKPRKPNPKNPVGASVASLVSPVKPGANSSITVRTTPGAACTIKVTYGEKDSQDSGLKKKAADDYGQVSWTWTVDRDAPAGKWPVEVLCKYVKQAGMVRAKLEVKP